RCPVASECLSSPGRQHPCSNIVGSQDAVPDGAFQVPEPWSGHLSTAPILFVSSNPSISYEEEYPIQSWSDEDLEDYFENRFGGGRKAWIHGGDRGLRTDGTYPPRGTRLWQSVRARAKESLGRDNVV